MKYRTFLKVSGAPDGSETRRAFRWYLRQIPRKLPLSTFVAMYYRPGKRGWVLPDPEPVMPEALDQAQVTA
jgi:hypothetical protein